MDQTNDSFFQHWFENQSKWAKTMFNQNPWTADPHNKSTDWSNLWKQNLNQWMNAGQSNGSASNQSADQQNFKSSLNSWGQFAKNYFDGISHWNADMFKSMENMTSSESFKGMMDMKDSFSKFFEMWSPMIKYFEKNAFTPKVFFDHLNPDQLKSFMDDFFKFMPDDSKKQWMNMNHQFIDYMKQIADQALSGKSANFYMGTNNGIWDLYSMWRNAMNETVSPLTKLMDGNSIVEQNKIWNDIADMMVEYNLKNSEMQMMIYTHGQKVMEKVAHGVYDKLQNGESIDSVIKIYQQWLITGDEEFTSLFQSDEYTKIMTEVSSLQMKIKFAVDKQIEKLFLGHLPVATRSEMEEVYKLIYDLKKTVRSLEKTLEHYETPVKVEVVKPKTSIKK